MLSSISGEDFPVLLRRHNSQSDDNLDKIEDLADDVLKGALQSSTLPLLSGIGVGFTIAAISGVPFIGAIASSYFIYTAVATAKRKGEEAEYIKDKGVLAHCLKEPELVRYAEIVGLQTCMDEIKTAYRDGQPITAAARKMLKASGETVTRRTIASFMEELKKLDAIPDDEKTLLIDAAAADVPAIAPAGDSYFNEKTGEGSFLLDAVMKSPGISRLMIGGQRTGKSYFAAVASKFLSSQGWKIYHINLASYGTEDSYYWLHTTKSVQGDLASITDPNEAKTLIESAIECLNEFWAEEKAILIADEISYIGSKFGMWQDAADEYLCLVAGRISALTSTGMKRAKAIWALCPELVSGSLKGPAKAVKSLDLMLFAIAPGRKVEWEGQEISFNKSLYGQVAYNFDGVSMPTDEQVALCETHSIDRICMINNEWIPVGELPALAVPIPQIPDSPAEILRAWGGANPYEVLTHGLATMLLTQNSTQESDPAIDLINEIDDPDKKEAMMIAYQWALSKSESSGEVRRSDFINRAKNDRNCTYLKLNRNQIWEELETLIEG